MVLPLVLIGATVAISGLSAFNSFLKTKREQEVTKQQESTLELAKIASKDPSLIVGLTKTKLDDVALIIKRAVPLLIIAVGIIFIIKKMGKK